VSFITLFELLFEIEILLRQRKSLLSKHFGNNEFIGAFAYLTDIFSSLITKCAKAGKEFLLLLTYVIKLKDFRKN